MSPVSATTVPVEGNPIINLVIDINLGTGYGSPQEFAVLGDQTVFRAKNATNNSELWTTEVVAYWTSLLDQGIVNRRGGRQADERRASLRTVWGNTPRAVLDPEPLRSSFGDHDPISSPASLTSR